MDDIIKNTTFPRRWSFRELDFFSGGTSVKIKSDERVKSVLGAIITLVIYVLLGLSIYYFLNEFLDTTNPNIQVNAMLSDKPYAFSTDSVNGIGGMHTFLLITNPALNAGISEPYYLSYDTLKRYYDYNSTYSLVTYEIDGLVSKKLRTNDKSVRLMPCEQTHWFRSEEFKTASKEHNMIKFVIANFGICPVFEEGMTIFGDDQTLTSGRYIFTLSPCTTGCDPLFAYSALTGNSGQHVVAGAFQPVVNTSNKAAPFHYEINMEQKVPIGVLLQSRAQMSLKVLDVQTDVGLFVSAVRSESRATVSSFRVTYDPVITVGESIASSVESFGVKYLPTTTPFELKIVSSSLRSETSRTYMTLPSLIGNIGGIVEAIALIFLLFSHWLQNLSLRHRVNYVVGKYLQLPSVIAPRGTLWWVVSSCHCPKKDKKTEVQRQAAQTITHLVDKALSVEQMCYNAILFRYFIENFLPDDIREAVPIVYVMREVLNQNRVRSRLAVKTDFGMKGLATCQTNPDQAKQEEGILEQQPETAIASNRKFLSNDMEVAGELGDHELQANQVEMDVPQEIGASRVVPSENRESTSTFRLRPRRLETEAVNSDTLNLSNHPQDAQPLTQNMVRSSFPRPTSPVLHHQQSEDFIPQMTQAELEKLDTKLDKKDLSSRNTVRDRTLLEGLKELQLKLSKPDEFQHLREGLVKIVGDFCSLLGVSSVDELSAGSSQTPPNNKPRPDWSP